MKYLHYFELKVPGTDVKMGYIVLSNERQMPPGHYHMSPMDEQAARKCAEKNGYHFNDLRVTPPKAATPEVPKDPETGKRPSAKCLDDARRLLGKGKYNTFTNFCYGDGYFARSCINKYGESLWDLACSIVKNE